MVYARMLSSTGLTHSRYSVKKINSNNSFFKLVHDLSLSGEGSTIVASMMAIAPLYNVPSQK